MNTVLLIPASGLLEVTYAEKALDLVELMQHRHTGRLVALATQLDDQEFTVLWFASTGPPNERARSVFAFLTGAHLLFTGPVGFADLPTATVIGIVADLSKGKL